MKDCIFCKIASREIPSEIIFEDENHVAFLDINPSTEGMTVVITKKHYDSDFYTNDMSVITEIMEASKKTAEMLKNKLGCERVLTSIEGLEVSHLHVKLYPFFGEGAETTKTPPTKEELKVLADKIRL